VDGCGGLLGVRTSRHNDIAFSIYRALSSLPKVEVIREPPIEGSSSLRNDIRVITVQGAPLSDLDIDLTVRSVVSGKTRPRSSRSLERSQRPGANLDTIADVTMKELDATLGDWRTKKAEKVNGIVGYDRLPYFHALPISTGGYTDPQGLRLLQSWKNVMSPSSYTNMIQEISMKLVRFRAYEGRI
jgi:C-terminal processing protease CtpA/Prc